MSRAVHDIQYHIAKETDWDPEKFIVILNYERRSPVSSWRDGVKDSVINRKIFGVETDSFGVFRDGSIKILQMDSYRTAEEARESLHSWLSRMDGCGLIVFPDLRGERHGSAEFFHEMRSSGMRCAELLNDPGLGFVMLGDEDLWIEMLRKRPNPDLFRIVF